MKQTETHTKSTSQYYFWKGTHRPGYLKVVDITALPKRGDRYCGFSCFPTLLSKKVENED